MIESVGLFVGAFLDALIGPNLFVPGEPFLLAAGYQLHQGSWYGVLAVFLGSFIGDQASFILGRSIGTKAQKKIVRWQPKARRPIARCRILLHKRGNYVMTFARLLGPVAWVVPFVAGSNHIRWTRFTMYSSIGLVLGVGQFILWGYLLGVGVSQLSLLNNLEQFAQHNQLWLMIGVPVMVAVLIMLVRKRKMSR
ncbi:DedA family protein [Vibrio sinus]|uniref:DedA family protein n=1 Tax=Vibrio sinus TaxID=2946865 RepID=UPI003D6F9D23